MQYKIRAKPTEYKGVRFRSKLEAQWAVYFDYHVGLEWEYEPRVVVLSWCRYLPDFWLPELVCWAEVKPMMFDLEAFTKANELKEPCLLLDGRPDVCKFYFITGTEWDGSPRVGSDGEPWSELDYIMADDPAHGSYDYYKSQKNYDRVDLVQSACKGRLWYNYGEEETTYNWYTSKLLDALGRLR